MRSPMKDYLREALVSVALFGSIGFAAAQAPAGNKDQANQPSSLSDQNAAQEPSAKGALPTDPAPKNTTAQAPDVFVDGSLNVPGAPAESSTKPAKFSQANDERDKTPIMARGPQLSDEQKKLIWDKVMAETSGPSSVAASPAMELPYTVEMKDWPQGVAGQIPEMQNFKYVKMGDNTILLVRPENRIVVGEIKP
jgi:hypothetical protein